MASAHWRRRIRGLNQCYTFLFQLLLVLVGFTCATDRELQITDQDVNGWAMRFAFQIYETSKHMTYVEDIRTGYKVAGARVERKDGLEMVKKISADIDKMLAWKIQAVQRITDTAEEAMLGHIFDPVMKLVYNNAKFLNKPDGVEMPMEEDKHFYSIPVNLNHSSIHVPTNVYNKAPDVVNAIKWSEHLNPIFKSNYNLDPSLNWQYFGSSTGFLRQYPAMEWRTRTVDTYDCRMRPWYIEAATSPKDLVILVDGSGSMTGLRKEIAKHVALNILDTLNDDDYFAIFRFSDTIEELVPCFKGSLVPANMENIREYKKGLQNVHTENIANFTLALISAFELLNKYNRSGEGSLCNQAIMLVTDGAPQMYEDVFNYYNQPFRNVRVFTYLIGQEMTDEKEMEWIACTNRGFYSHVSTIAEARDQVQNYVPVMARPLVLHSKHSVIWTSVYADIEDPKMSDWLWERKEKDSQKAQLREHMERYYRHSDEEYSTGLQSDEPEPEEVAMVVRDSEYQKHNDSYRNSDDSNSHSESNDDPNLYRLMTTVAYPVFDRRNYSSRVAHILGVAGTDVPIDEITKLATPFKLGVNGYAYAITNNGYIVFHPDLRPVHEGILKPDYNSVDLSEAELRDIDLPPRANDTLLLMLRKRMIDRETNHTKMGVRVHMDNMKRVVTRTHNYFFTPLKDTPFSFGIAMPDGYGMYEVVGEIDLKKIPVNPNQLDYKRGVLQHFQNGKWALHPDWVYCRYLFSNSERPAMTKEETFMSFLTQVPNRNFSWKNHPKVKNLPRAEDYSKSKKININEFYCDKELVESLVFDAGATKNHGRRGRNDKQRISTAKTHGITVAFVATRSGLTRWEEFEPDGSNFIEKNNRAIDELWYKRAVDYHTVDNASFVFSVPFDAWAYNNSLVTGSFAIFLGEGHRVSPAAVVGLQIKHSYFVELFKKITYDCPGNNCKLQCMSPDINCYLLDDHGFTIVSENHDDTGKFYGDLDRNIFNTIVQDGIYKKLHIIDYQAVCSDPLPMPDSASLLIAPLMQLRNLLAWMWGKFMFFYLNYNFYNWWKEGILVLGSSGNDDNGEYSFLPHDMILNKTRPRPCDKEFFLYQLQPRRFEDSAPRRGKLYSCGGTQNNCNKSFVLQLVPHTNLLFLVVDASCNCESNMASAEHVEINYNFSQMCQWLSSNIYRRRPEQCTSYHPQELDIKGHCGSGTRLSSAPVFTLTIAAIMATCRWLRYQHLSS